MRVFSAVEVSGELADELLRIREAVDLGFSPVRKKNFHLTLQFFEDLDEEELEEVIDAAHGVNAENFEAEVRGLGAFPSEDHIRVVWAGVSGEEIFGLKRQVSDHSVGEDNGHDFHPHITLLRVNDIDRGRKRKLQRSLEEFQDHFFGTLEVERVRIFESKNGYREIETVEL